MLAETVDALVGIRRVPKRDLVQRHGLAVPTGRALHAGNAVVHAHSERQAVRAPRSSVFFCRKILDGRRERELVPRLEFGVRLELLPLRGHLEDVRLGVPEPLPDAIRVRVLLDQSAADDDALRAAADRPVRVFNNLLLLRVDLVHGLHGGLQPPVQAHAEVSRHHLVDAHGAVRGDQERRPGDGGPRFGDLGDAVVVV